MRIMKSSIALALCSTLSCASSPPPMGSEGKVEKMPEPTNPLTSKSTLPYEMPPFDQIKDEHFEPAFDRGMAEELQEIDAIAKRTEAPTVENTIIAMQKTGATLDRTSRVFFGLVSANTNDTLESVRTKMAPKLSAHRDAILLNPDLYQRVKAIYEARDTLGLDPETKRLVEITHRDFVRAGATLSPEDKKKLEKINADLATLSTKFSQNVLDEVNDLPIIIDDKAQLKGMSEDAIRAAEEEGKKRKLDGKLVISLLNTSGQPPLSSLEDRALRKRIYEASISRGSRGGKFDNREVLAQIVKLRAERAQLLGYDTFAAYILEIETAKNTKAVNDRLALLAPAAVANAKKELKDLEKMAKKDGIKDFGAWDWAYYTEKVRAERFAFDESKLRPYLELDSVLKNGVFFAATKLFGMTFKERTDLPTYHPDVRVFEVFEEDGTPLALFLFDPFARASKVGGAWMNEYVSQSKLLGTRPVVANHLNISKPPEGQRALLTFDEVTTMFHEFGHALHGMFSNVSYPEFAGTNVPRDFVEYPSQVNEMWAIWPEVLQNYAKHHETGEPMPKVLLDKVLATQTFNQGFATTEYLEASLLDQAWHQLKPEAAPNAEHVVEFENAALKKYGVKLDAVPPRYRSTYFSHSMGEYSAGYYSYIWSEVLDADTVEWFKESGGLLRKNGDHFRQTLLSKGGSADAMEVFRGFRGKDASIEPLLKRRGLKLSK